MSPTASQILADHRAWLADPAAGRRLIWHDLTHEERVTLRRADLRGADLRDALLTGAVLIGADLRGAGLRRTDLSGALLIGADLRGADLPPAPAIPDIHRALYDAITADGCMLYMGEWHTCETTHCRAGWVVTLAGDAGRELEASVGTAAAATLIYMASDPALERVPNWYASDEDAMDDIRRLAGV